MNVIGRQAIASQCHPVECNILPQQTEINRTISIAIQDETPPVPPLRQVVWNIHGDNSSQSCHMPSALPEHAVAPRRVEN
jgi:hypothetical protein